MQYAILLPIGLLVIKNVFPNFSTKSHDMDTEKNRLNETVLILRRFFWASKTNV